LPSPSHSSATMLQCSSPFPRSWVDSEQTLSVMDGRPRLFHNLPLPSVFYTGTHFAYPEGWPGWVGLGGWLNTERVRTRFELINVTHPSTNRARRRITTLIETNALPLHQTTKSMLTHQCLIHFFMFPSYRLTLEPLCFQMCVISVCDSVLLSQCPKLQNLWKWEHDRCI